MLPLVGDEVSRLLRVSLFDSLFVSHHRRQIFILLQVRYTISVFIFMDFLLFSLFFLKIERELMIDVLFLRFNVNVISFSLSSECVTVRSMKKDDGTDHAHPCLFFFLIFNYYSWIYSKKS